MPEKDHLIIVGYGFNGRNLARAARLAKIPYEIIEMNPDTVKDEAARGERIVYGDASYEAVLEHVHAARAKAIVVAISDAAATRRIIEQCRGLNPNAWILARTRFVMEIQPLLDLGADEVIPEEFETSVEIFARVLSKYLVPENEIDRFVARIRTDAYNVLRSRGADSRSMSDLKLHLRDLDISIFEVEKHSAAADHTLSELEMRKRYGANLLALERENEIITDLHGGTLLRNGDRLYVLGTHEGLAAVNELFRGRGNS